jgi:hypothetical protein
MPISIQSHCDMRQRITGSSSNGTKVLEIGWGWGRLCKTIGKIRMRDKTDKQNVDDVETERDQVCFSRRNDD